MSTSIDSAATSGREQEVSISLILLGGPDIVQRLVNDSWRMCSQPAGTEDRREGADALVRDARGRVLLVRRADDGRWAMPGGWVDPGETPAQAVVREVAEETGLRVSAPRLLHTKLRPASVHYTFGCELDGGDLRISDESLEAAFVSPDEIDEWHTDHHERLTAALARLA